MSPNAQSGPFALALYVFGAVGLSVVTPSGLAAMAQIQAAPLQFDMDAAEATVTSCFAALNGARVTDILPLYTEDGVITPPDGQGAQGQTALRKEYEGLFKNLSFRMTFMVHQTALPTAVDSQSLSTVRHHVPIILK